MLFIFLLRAKLLRNNDILARISLILLKKLLKESWNSFNVKYETQLKERRNSYQVKQILGLFLTFNCSKFTLRKCEKFYSQQNYQRNWVWRSLQGDRIKKSFQRQYFAKYLGATLVLISDCPQREKFSFYFSSFLL